MPKIYYDEDVEIGILEDKIIGIVGYGSQGHAQALNLRDSGLKVIIGELKGVENWKRAKEDGFQVMTADEVTKEANIVQLLAQDHVQASIYKNQIRPVSKAMRH